MAKGLSFGRLLYDFSLWCTIACLNKIVTSVKWLAVIFTGIFLVMCFLFVFISTNCTLKFFKFPSSTELSIDMKSTPFPRFSFCNENPMKRSVVDSNGAYAEIAKMLNQYERIEYNMTTADDYELATTKSRLQRMHRARLMLRLLMAKLSDADRIAAGYNFTELVTECTFGGELCTSADFTPFLHPEYGVCFTFNGERMIAKAGKAEGLRMLMTVNQYMPSSKVFDFMPTTDSVTVWGVIYDQADYPDFMKGGFRSTHERMEPPYGNCTNDGSKVAEYYGNYTYTVQLCQHVCLQEFAAEKCGCVDPLHPKLDNQTYCTTGANMLCLITLTNDIKAANSPEGTTLCDCRAPCNDVVYDKTITNGIFPSANYKVAAGTQKQRDVLLEGQDGGRPGDISDDEDDYDNPSPTTTILAVTKGTTKAGVATTTTLTARTTTNGDTSVTTYHEETTIDAKSTTSTGATASTSTLTTSTTPTSTTTAEQCKYEGPPVAATAALLTKEWCRNVPELFNDPNIIAIQGYPCTSTKNCQTCVFFANPPSTDSFICSYDYPYGCPQKTNTGYLPSSSDYHLCSTFFSLFDFIPIGTNVPNISNWWTGTKPGSVAPCFDEATKDSCWSNTVCQTNRSTTDLTALKSIPGIPLDPDFLNQLTSTTTPCEMAAAALTFAGKKYNPLSGLGKRKKRDTGSANAIADMPGWGSCEYANKNFKGKEDCIAWYKLNGLLVHIYFETLQVQSYTQGATYPLVALISDISGHAGLWLGMSVVSVVELIALIFMCFSCLFCGRKINLPNKEEIKASS